MKKILLFASLLFLSFGKTYSQNGTDFWFVAPEVTEQGNHDRPIYLEICTGALDADVTISQPAQAAGVGLSAVRHILKNSIDVFDVTQWIDQIESGIVTANQHNDNVIEKKGIHITSTAGISCYYEVQGMDLGNPNPDWRTQIWNSEIFTMKGSAALGTRFYTPFQKTLKNGFDGWSAIHIVATMNNTHVTIVPTANLVGHKAGIPFTITLNQGETYCGRATSQTGAGHPGGSVVTSDKPIAVTIKDDSVFLNSGADLMGDQIVPTNIVGTDYIIVKGYLNPGGDRAIICATENNTVVTVNGNPTPVATLKAGEQFDYPVGSGSVYLQTSSPAYVFQISGIGDELAGALLPPIICTGSRNVSFTRDTDDPFYMNILVQTQFVNGFTLNGAVSLQIAASAFTSVPNSPAPGWSTAQIQFTPSQLKTAQAYTVSNTLGNFHLGILNGAITNSSSRYGYFSDYNSSVGQLGGDVTICQGESHTFDLGSGFSDIVWNNTPSVDSIFKASTAGPITVSASKGGCPLKSTVRLLVNTPPQITMQPSISTPVCENVNTVIAMDGTGSDSTFQWEVSTDGGATYSSLKNGNPYFDVSTKSLTINVSAAMNGYKFRGLMHGVCGSDPAPSNVVTLKTEDNPNVVASPSDVEICLGIDAFFNVSATGNKLKYQWQEKSGSNDFVDLSKSGKYAGTDSSSLRILLPSVSMNGNQYRCIVNGVCKSTTSNPAHLKVDALGCNEIRIPNVFTPHTTPGYNDFFVIDGNKPGSLLKIYNRWGILLHTFPDYKNDWDGGSYSDGVYFYIYTFSGDNKQYKGFVEVIR